MSKRRLLEQQKKYDEWKRKRDARESGNLDLERPVCEADNRPNPPNEHRLSSVHDEPKRVRSKEAEENRRKYPEIARFVDECRRVFGPDVRVVSITPLQSPTNHGSDEADAQDDPQSE